MKKKGFGKRKYELIARERQVVFSCRLIDGGWKDNRSEDGGGGEGRLKGFRCPDAPPD